jgi:hypothetical protein
MAHSTIIPHAMTIPIWNTMVNHAPIGTPHSSRPTPSLPLGYHALNPSVAIHTQVMSKVQLGCIIPLLVMFPHLPRSSPEGLIHLFMVDLDLVAPIQLEAFIIFSLLVTRFPLEENLMLGGTSIWGSNSIWGTTSIWRTILGWSLSFTIWN